MAAEKGNKYAEKWNKENALQLLKDALNTLIKDKDIMYIGELAEKQSTYHHVYTYIVDKFGKENKVFSTIKKKIDNIIETRLFKEALKNNVNPTVAIFGLKNNYNWRDKRDIDVTTKGDKITGDPFKEIRKNSDVQETDEETKDGD